MSFKYKKGSDTVWPAYQVDCVRYDHYIYHAHGARTSCSKTMGFDPSDEASKQDVLRRLKTWAVEGLTMNSRAEHRSSGSDLAIRDAAMLLTDEELERRRPDAPPRIDGIVVPKAKAQSRSKAKARAKKRPQREIRDEDDVEPGPGLESLDMDAAANEEMIAAESTSSSSSSSSSTSALTAQLSDISACEGSLGSWHPSDSDAD